MIPADPDAVIAAVRRWLGTPYHDQASLRGVGCDCLGLARGVWREVVGAEPQAIPPLPFGTLSGCWWQTRPRPAVGLATRAVASGASADRL